MSTHFTYIIKSNFYFFHVDADYENGHELLFDV